MRSLVPGNALSAAVCLLLAAGSLYGQVDTATITGVITDPSGAAIVGASIKATHLATGVIHRAEANVSGVYTLSALPIGNYDMEATSEGFQTVRRPNITLNAGTRARIDVEMTLGQVTEIIEVTGEVPLLESETSSLGQVIENKTITQMPLNGRNYQELAMLSAGVLPNRSQNFVEDGFSANGASFDQNVFTLDGADNNNYFSGVVVASNQAVKPSIDAVQEFKIDTHTYGAEFGRGGGAVMQISTKSGTNQFHGTLFEFLRNQVLDANNFFNAGRDKPPYRQNQFGGTIGGPIQKDKMFFFASYEGTRIREQITRRSTIPNPAQVNGDFSGLATIYDPATQSSTGARDPFPNNVIPQDRIDPVAFRMIDLYPAPNVAGTVANNFIFNSPRNRDDDKIDWRYDYKITDNHSIFLRHSYLNFDRLEPGNLPLPASGANTAVRLSRGNTGVLSWTALLPGGTKVNEMRVAYNRLKGGIDTPTQTQLWRDFGFQGLFDREDINGLPAFRPTGYQNIGDRNYAPDPRIQDVRQFVDTFSWNKGKHSIKTGVNLRNYIRWSGITNFARGRFDFNRQFTRSMAGGGSGGDGIADALLGLTSNTTLSSAVNARRHAWSYETYFQDTWKATRKLTLNIGVRYEQQTQYTEQNLRVSNFIWQPGDPNFATLVDPTPGSRSGESFVQRDKNDWAPRIGFAYQMTDKTVIRGGYGIFYLGNFVLSATRDPSANPPFFLIADTPTNSQASTSNLIVQDGFPADLLDPNAPLDGKALFGAWPDAYPNGMTNQWNINVQRTLPGNALFSIAYVGSNTINNQIERDINQPEPGPGSNNSRRFLPQFSNITTRMPLGGSNYQGLEAKFERRFAGGFSFLSGFTYSKTLEQVGLQRQSIYHFATEKTISNQHMPQRFFFSSVYDLPFGKGRRYVTDSAWRHIVGGWQVSPIFEVQRGLYVSPGVAGNPANTTGGQRPDRIGDHRIPRTERTADRWFDTGAFAVQEQFTFGNSAANVIEGPGLVNLDLMINRTFRFNERLSLDFRTELYNMFNRVNLSFPNTTINNPAGGTISQTATSARQMQFGMKLIF